VDKFGNLTDPLQIIFRERNAWTTLWPLYNLARALRLRWDQAMDGNDKETMGNGTGHHDKDHHECHTLPTYPKGVTSSGAHGSDDFPIPGTNFWYRHELIAQQIQRPPKRTMPPFSKEASLSVRTPSPARATTSVIPPQKNTNAFPVRSP